MINEILKQDVLSELLQKVTSYLPDADTGLIRHAYEFAYRAHSHQRRVSGEPYINHLLGTALILVDFRLDEASIAAALLHDVIEDTDCTYDLLAKDFGFSIADLVNGVTKLTQITSGDHEDRHAESLTKMFLAMSHDIRVVMIKLADRLHNMRTLYALDTHKQIRIARETMDIYAPLAYRLGIWALKSEFEDLAFRYLQPKEHKIISELLAKYEGRRNIIIKRAVETVNESLSEAGIVAELLGRAKHLYGIYQKMIKRGKEFDQVYDVFAIRIIVLKVQDCYTSLGVIHSLWRPVPNRVKDYIAAPRNLYRSLHTTVLFDGNIPLEVQIRTHEMHMEAEYGVAAHWRYRDWRYKQFGLKDSYFAEQVAWLQQLTELWKEAPNARDFVEMLKSDVFQDRVYVFTPKRDIIDLPKDSTPIDFAYHIHTEIGHRCRGAKVNGRIVPLSYKLHNGDQVEILTAKRGGPSRDWLNSQLSYLATSRARAKVRQWFKRQNYEEHVAQGRAILDRELHRLGITELNYEKLAREFNFHKVDDFLATIGRGDISIPQIISAINDIVESTKPVEEVTPADFTSPSTATTIPTGIKIQGVGNMLTNLAQCCRPVPGDDAIIGFVTRGRGVTIHRRDCPNILGFNDEGRARLIEVDWDMRGDDTYPVDVEIEAFDRPGLLRDITAVLANEKINISSVSVITRKKEMKAKIMATLDIANLDQLGRVLNLIAQVPNIVEVRRRRQ